MKNLLIIGAIIITQCVIAERANPLEDWADKQEVWKKLRIESTAIANRNRALSEIYGYVRGNLDNFCHASPESDNCKAMLNAMRKGCPSIDSYGTAQSLFKQAYDNGDKLLLAAVLNGIFEKEGDGIIFDLHISESDAKAVCAQASPACAYLKEAITSLLSDKTLTENQKKYVVTLQKQIR